MRVAVVGRGLIGSAATKYLARAGHDVVLVGPDEPADKAAHRGVFASHYDAGRITRTLDADPFWSRVSRASIARYCEIERESGIGFFVPCGAMMAGPADGRLMRGVAAVRDTGGINAERLDRAALAREFPFLRFGADDIGYLERHEAGYVDPRALIRAQTRLAQEAGARVAACEASALTPAAGGIAVSTKGGAVEADQVLIAAGAFSTSLAPGALALRVYARTVALFELNGAETERLRTMPCVVYQAADGRDPYLLPPIRYPDGRTYLKLGGDPEDRVLEGLDAIKAWFRGGGSAQVGAALRRRILDWMPELRYERMHVKPCVTTYTAADRPDIRRLDPLRAVATAGCGRGAKCSDELGRMAADLFG